MEKRCYICLPISGQVGTAFRRAEEASEVVKKMGYKPITPMEINNETQETLDNPYRPIEEFMGNDIRILIGECDAIYICDGWQNSKGCSVEVECAKQYNKEIFYQTIPIENRNFKDVITDKANELYQQYRTLSENHGPASFEVSVIKRKITEYRNFLKENFGIEKL